MDNGHFQMKAQADLGLVTKGQSSERIVEIIIQAPELAEDTKIPGLNLALVLDRSGSMSGGKLGYVKQAAEHVLDLLSNKDRVAIVVYDDQVNVIAESMQINETNRVELKRKLSLVHTGGTTALCDGWLAGCEQVATVAKKDTLDRTLLLTDGLANVGETDPEKLAMHARELAIRGVSTTTFGVGLDFNESLLQSMAQMGGGNFYFIEKPDDIPGLFQSEFRDLTSVAVRDVELSMQLPESVKARLYGGWRHDIKDGHLKIYPGNLVSGRVQSFYLKLDITAEFSGNEVKIPVHAFGKGKNDEVLECKAEVVLRIATKQDVDVAQPDQDLIKRFAEIDLAETANEALKLEREGRRNAARVLMQQSVATNQPFVNPSRLEEYKLMSERMAAGLNKEDRKRVHYQAHMERRHRQNFPLKLVYGHLLAEMDGRTILVDTGCPVSIGRHLHWVFMEQSFELSRSYMGISVDDLSNLVNERVDILLGADLLQLACTEIDLADQIIVFRAHPELHTDVRIPIEQFMGVPSLQANIRGKDVNLIIDSGSQYSYLRSDMVSGMKASGKARDFYPGFGEFDTDLYDLDVTLGGKHVRLKFGVLPRMLETAVLVTRSDGLLGTELFQHFRAELAIPHKFLALRDV
jgi:Ca-activated chloride channel family protein